MALVGRCSDPNFNSFISRTDSFSWAADEAKKDIDQYRGLRQYDHVLQTEGGALGLDPRAIHVDSKGGLRRYDTLRTDGAASKPGCEVLQTEGGATMVSFGSLTSKHGNFHRQAESLPPPQRRQPATARFTQLEHTIRADKLASTLRQPVICTGSMKELHLRRVGWNMCHHLGKSALEDEPIDVTPPPGLESTPRTSVKPSVENIARPFRATYYPTHYSLRFAPDTDTVNDPLVPIKAPVEVPYPDFALALPDSQGDSSAESSPVITPCSPLSMDSAELPAECSKKADPDDEDDIASTSTRAPSTKSSRRSSRELLEQEIANMPRAKEQSAVAKAHPTQKQHESVKAKAQSRHVQRRPPSRANVQSSSKPRTGTLAQVDLLEPMARMKQILDAEGGRGRVDRLEATLLRLKQVAQEVYAE